MSRERGQTLNEYGLVLGAIASGVIIAAAVAFIPRGDGGEEGFQLQPIGDNTIRIGFVDREGYLEGLDVILSDPDCEIVGYKKGNDFVDVELEDASCFSQ